MTETPNTPEPEASPPERLQSKDASDRGFGWHVPLLIVVSVAGLAYVVVDGLSSETYFFEVDEAVARADSMAGQEVRVKGRVVEGSVEGEEGSVGRNFKIHKSGAELRVVYDKALPDTFEEDAEVVATGRLADDRTLRAERVLVKCPSRYEGKPPTSHKKGRESSSSSANYGE